LVELTLSVARPIDAPPVGCERIERLAGWEFFNLNCPGRRDNGPR